MKNDLDDKALREKMDSLDTLSGGIVFGKEAAWEKLQTRMEHKPAKNIFLHYWMAAAAILLLFVCVVTVYNYPQKEVVIKDNSRNTTPPAYKTIIAPQKTTQSSKALPINSELQAKEKEQISIVIKKEKNVAACRHIDIQVVQSSSVENKPDKTITGNLPLETPAVKAIDEVQSTAVNTTQEVDFDKMRVVYINDVEKEEKEVRQIRKENRMTWSHYPFLTPANDYDNPEEYNGGMEYNEPHKLLKSIFNPQN